LRSHSLLTVASRWLALSCIVIPPFFSVGRVAGLKNRATFGTINPQVSITVNSDKQYTRTIDDTCHCTFNETLNFNIDCQPEDLIYIKVKHDRFAADIALGCFSMTIGEFVRHQQKLLRIQLVDDDDFQLNGALIEVTPVYTGTNQPPPYKSPSPPAQ
jgi:hypothetical protein